jgi:hypothetical protein
MAMNIQPVHEEEEYRNSDRNERSQLLAYLAVSLCILGFTVILSIFPTASFRLFFGDVPALLFIPMLIIGGFVCMKLILSRGWFSIYKRENLKQLPRLSIVAILFLSGAIFVDFTFPFPVDINLPFPKSALFYPIMGYVVEILFHIIPLTILLGVLVTIFKNADREKILFACILIVSLLEPIYQGMLDPSIGKPLWLDLFDGTRLFLFSFVQLNILKRYDFVSMYSFRIVYYLLWHILWGSIRLLVLF